MDGGKDWLESILKRNAYEETPIKILSVEEGGAAPGKGEHYLSNIQKIEAKVLFGSGRIKNLLFVIKNEPATEQMKKFVVENGIFEREIRMYRDVLLKMQQLLEKINDPDGIFWAKCYDVRLYNRLVFEDLGASGFRMADRQKQLSLNAALLTLKKLATFHALSRLLLDKGEIPMAVFEHHMWMKTPEAQELTRKWIKTNVRETCEKLETWGEEWKEASKRLAQSDLSTGNLESLRPKPHEFAVLVHGDTWTNNMLFRGEDLENPTSFRLLDFQICFINTPAFDLSKFFISSVRLEDQIQNMDILLQTYTDTLQSYLLKLGYKGAIPTIEDLRRSLQRLAPMTLNDTMRFVPVVMRNAEDALDLEDILSKQKEAKDRGEDVEFSPVRKLTPNCIAIIKHQISKAMESGLI